MHALKPRNRLAVLAFVALAAVLPAQGQEAGLGAVLAGPMDIEALGPGALQQLGATYIPATNSIIISGRGNVDPLTGVRSANPPHTFFEMALPTPGSTTATPIRQITQAAGTAASAWGCRDGATDSGGLVFLSGDENNLYAYDPLNGFAEINGTITWLAANGAVTSTATYPLPNPGFTGIGTLRALAFNPAGNGGNGSLWVGDFGNDLVEFDIDGVEISRIAAIPNLTVYGLAFDERTGNLWGNSAPNAGELAEIDIATGTLTGATVRRSTFGATQGGLDIISGAAAQAAYGVDAVLIGVDQSDPDQLTVYRLHRYPAINGGDELQLRASVDGGAFGTALQPFTFGSTLRFEFSDPTGTLAPASAPAILLANVGPDALTNAATLGLAESVAPNLFTAPASTLTFTLGNGLLPGTPISNGDLPLGPNLAPGQSAPLPVSFNLAGGTPLRLQGFVFDTRVPGGIVATNTVRLEATASAAPGVTVAAEGANSFRNVAAAPGANGYWTITNTQPAGTLDIVEVTLDFGAAAAGTPAVGTVFDYDQLLNAAVTESFVNGNAVGTCVGSFLNGSDVATGLIYDSANSFAAGSTFPVPCDATAFCGWSTTGALTGSTTNVTFRFTTFGSGQTFTFDCDTDAGTGVQGSDMAGLVVTVRYSDNSVVSGALAADPFNSQRSFIDL